MENVGDTRSPVDLVRFKEVWALGQGNASGRGCSADMVLDG